MSIISSKQLSALALTSKNINDNSVGKNEYYLVKLNLNTNMLTLYGFKDSDEAKNSIHI